MNRRTHVIVWFIACLALSGSIAAGAALPMSVTLAAGADPFQDLGDYLHSIFLFAFFLTMVFTFLTMVLLGLSLVPAIAGHDSTRNREERRITENLMLGLILWIGIPFVLGGMHLTCWFLEPSTRHAGFSWIRAAPISTDFRNAWFLLHGVAAIAAIGLWYTVRVLRRFQRSNDGSESRCHACGYPLCGLTGLICPECGEEAQAG